MTNRRKPQQRTTKSDWKPTRDRSELVKAISAGAGIVVATALLIFLMKPSDATSAPATNTPVTVDSSTTLPTDSSTTLPVDSSTTLPAGSTSTTTAPG